MATLVPRLSTMRVLIPQRLIQLAIMSPAGPAPMMRTSTSESGRRGAIVRFGGVEGLGLWDTQEGDETQAKSGIEGVSFLNRDLVSR